MWQRVLILSFSLLIQSWTLAVAETAHMFTFKSIDGEPIALSEYTGKAILVVNTASRCGFTQQYNGLQSLWEKYRDNGLVVIGVPSNDFGGQEPGTEKEPATRRVLFYQRCGCVSAGVAVTAVCREAAKQNRSACAFTSGAPADHDNRRRGRPVIPDAPR